MFSSLSSVPLLELLPEPELELLESEALPELLEHMQKAGFHGGKVRITHVNNPALANTFLEQLKVAWPGADASIAPSSGLCSYYAEEGAIMVGFECN